MFLYRITFKVVLDVDTITEKGIVVKQVQRQARAQKCRQLIIAQGLRSDVSFMTLNVLKVIHS